MGNHQRPLTDHESDTWYVSGMAATALLVEQAGTGSILEYFHRAARAESQSEADDVFQDVFGLTVAEFYILFERARNSPPVNHIPQASQAVQL